MVQLVDWGYRRDHLVKRIKAMDRVRHFAYLFWVGNCIGNKIKRDNNMSLPLVNIFTGEPNE